MKKTEGTANGYVKNERFLYSEQSTVRITLQIELAANDMK